jgi:hypothetical protein
MRTTFRFLGLFLMALACLAQSTGELSGTVRDSSGAAVPNAQLALVDSETGVEWHGVTNESGIYRFAALRPGTYTLTVSMQGFRETRITAVAVEVGRVTRTDTTLDVAAAADQVTVTAGAQLIDFDTSAKGSVITLEEMKKLPLQFRNATSLLILSPGVQTTGGNFALNRLSSGGDTASSTYTINGGVRYGRGGFNELVIDGISMTNREDGSMASLPSSEAIREFQVQSGAMSSEFGNTGGGVINISTRGGTNQYHGNFFYAHRSSATMARLALPATAAKPPNIVHLGNMSVSGPVIRNRTFVFFGYEHVSWLRKEARTDTIPTLRMREGDFTESPNVIYDPATASRLGDRMPFAGNRVPTARFNRFGKRILDLYPQPTFPTVASNVQGSRNIHQANDNYLGRIDHVLSDRQRLMFRVAWVDPISRQDWHLGDVDQDSSNLRIPSRSYVSNYSYTMSPSLVFQLAAGYVRVSRVNVDPFGNTVGASFFGHSVSPPVSNPAANTTPGARFDIYRGVGLGSGQNTTNESFQANPSMVWIRGKHALRSGGDLRRYRASGLIVFGAPNGAFTFNALQTSNGAARTGNSAASAILGLASSANFQQNPFISMSNNVFALYVQDDFKIRPDLSLNFGLRWDGESPISERWNRVGFFDPLATNPVIGIPGTYRYAGLNGAPTSITQGDLNNISPRVGFSYAPGRSRRMTIRGGFATFFAPYPARGYYGAAPGFEATLAPVAPAAGEPALVLRESYQLPQAEGPQGDAAYLGRGFTEPFGRGQARALSYQWNFGIQRELAPNIVLEVAYTGNRGVRLLDGFDLNFPPEAVVNQAIAAAAASGRAAAALEFLNQRVPNPIAGKVPGALGTATTTLQRAVTPFPHYTAVNTLLNNRDSIYHALQTSLQKRLSGSLNMMVAYTWSKVLDNVTEQNFGQDANAGAEQNIYNLRDARSPGIFDRTHKLVISTVYELPFGRGRAYASTGLWPHVAGGWRLAGMLNAETGQPMAIRQTTSNGLPGAARPDVLGDPLALSKQVRRTVASNGNVMWINPAAYQTVNGRYGTAPLRDSRLRGPGFWSLDLGLQREFRITERVRFRFRAEAFNSMNRTNFRNPEQNVNSPAFGQISQVNDPRQFQFGAEVSF